MYHRRTMYAKVHAIQDLLVAETMKTDLINEAKGEYYNIERSSAKSQYKSKWKKAVRHCDSPLPRDRGAKSLALGR